MVLMKRFFQSTGIVVALAIATALTVAPRPAEAGPALLLEPARGEVLFAESPDESWYPASLTKIMTAYLTFEAVKTGKIAWNGKVPLSEKARGQPATRIGLRAGIEITVEQAVRGLILRSANDFAMALAELIGGSEEAFAELQNATAKRLGMTRTHFKNPHGLPDPEQVTTARDMGILAAALLRDFPDRAEVFSTQQVQIHRGTFHSQNDILRTFQGADGMKTGFTCGAGYNVVASATRNGRQIVAVVLGALTRTTRTERASKLLEMGFAHIDGKYVPKDGEPQLKTVALKDLPLDPAEQAIVHDMSKETQTHKCGNRVRRAPGIAAVKAGRKAAAQPAKGQNAKSAKAQTKAAARVVPTSQ